MKRLFMVLALSVTLHAADTIQDAQRDIEEGRPGEALAKLRLMVVKEPESVTARYNYAVAAYSAGRYAAALEMLEKPGDESEDLRGRRLFQAGNARYRLALLVAARSPEDAVAELAKAHDAFAASADLVSGERDKAKANLALARAESGQLMLGVARARGRAADLASRRAPEDGIDLWSEALDWYARAVANLPDDPSRVAADSERSAIARRLGDAALDYSRRQQRQAAGLLQRGPGRAIDLYRQVIELLQRIGPSLGARAEIGLEAERARRGLRAALLAYGNERRSAGAADLAMAPRRAAADFEEATALFREAGASEQVAATEVLLRDALERSGDEEVAAADMRPEDTPWVIDHLNQAAADYGWAQRLRGAEPNGSKLAHTHRRLSGLFLEAGERYLHDGQAEAADNVEPAIADLEKAVQSFRLSLSHWEENAPARAGLESGSSLLAQLRDRLAAKQRETAEKIADQIKDPKKIGTLPKDLALKLLDYRNNQAAAKGPQLIALPETPVVNDW
jgi:hypothetical protein